MTNDDLKGKIAEYGNFISQTLEPQLRNAVMEREKTEAEINDYIQAEAGNNANIIMGVGEDENLGDSISVTVIATGFNAEQQKEFVNLEPKKIIHVLGNEQKTLTSEII